GYLAIRFRQSHCCNHVEQYHSASVGVAAILRFARTQARVHHVHRTSYRYRDAADRERYLQNHQKGVGSACLRMIDIRGKFDSLQLAKPASSGSAPRALWWAVWGI